MGNGDNIPSSGGGSNTIFVDTGADRINTPVQSGKVLVQNDDHSIWLAGETIANPASWSINNSKRVTGSGDFPNTSAGFDFYVMSLDGTTMIVDAGGAGNNFHEYTLQDVGNPKGAKTFQGAVALPLVSGGIKYGNFNHNGTKYFSHYVGAPTADRIIELNLTNPNSIAGGFTTGSVWILSNFFTSNYDTIRGIAFNQSGNKFAVAAVESGTRNSALIEFEITNGDPFTATNPQVKERSDSTSNSYGYSSPVYFEANTLGVISMNTPTNVEVYDTTFGLGIDCLLGSVANLTSIILNTTSATYTYAFVSPTTGCLYANTDRFSEVSAYAYELNKQLAWVLVTAAPPAPTYGEWWLPSPVLVSDTLPDSGDFDLSSIPEWAGDVRKANFAVVEVTAAYSTNKTNEGTLDEKYGIQITAGGRLIADATVKRGTQTQDADDSTSVKIHNPQVEVPIVGGELAFDIAQNLPAVGEPISRYEHELSIVGFKRKVLL